MTEPMGERGRQGAAPLGGHTPGPWAVDGPYILSEFDWRHCVTTKSDRALVAVMQSPDDARLIAAAPELLEALERIAEHLALYPKQPLDRGCHAVVRTAIAKARGEQ